MFRTLPSRRDLFLGAGAIASTALTPSFAGAFAPVQAAQPRPERRSIDDLTAAELELYEHAVRLLRAKAQSFAGDGLLHPLLRQAVLPDAAGAGRQWHRRDLEAIEAQLRATDPAVTHTVAVPFWDFTRPPSGQHYPRAFERAGSPLYTGNPDQGPNHLDPVFWSYHAYIDTVWQRWESGHGPLAPGMVAHLWIGQDKVEIRTSRAFTA